MKKKEIQSKLHPFITQNKKLNEDQIKAINIMVDKVANMSAEQIHMFIAPDYIKDAVKYINECHNDMGFLGSPKYFEAKKAIEEYQKLRKE